MMQWSSPAAMPLFSLTWFLNVQRKKTLEQIFCLLKFIPCVIHMLSNLKHTSKNIHFKMKAVLPHKAKIYIRTSTLSFVCDPAKSWYQHISYKQYLLLFSVQNPPALMQFVEKNNHVYLDLNKQWEVEERQRSRTGMQTCVQMDYLLCRMTSPTELFWYDRSLEKEVGALERKRHSSWASCKFQEMFYRRKGNAGGYLYGWRVREGLTGTSMSSRSTKKQTEILKSYIIKWEK